MDVWLTDHGRQGALAEKGDRARCVLPHLGFKSKSGLSKFLRRDLSRPLGRPANDGRDPAAIFEQTPLVLRLKARISETGEMEHRPEAIGSIREIVARDDGAQSRIETAEDYVQTPSEDIRFISDQINLLVELPCRGARWQPPQIAPVIVAKQFGCASPLGERHEW